MARVCILTGKRTVTGNNVSHANNKTRRTFKPNLQTKRFKLSNGRTIKLRLSSKALRNIDKEGSLEAYLAKNPNNKLAKLVRTNTEAA